MIVTAVLINVKPEHVDEFIEACKRNHEGSVKEPGNLRFDFLQEKDDPNSFMFYEAYKSEEAVAEHKETEHYQTWRDTVADWMATPRQGIPHNVICPADESAW